MLRQTNGIRQGVSEKIRLFLSPKNTTLAVLGERKLKITRTEHPYIEAKRWYFLGGKRSRDFWERPIQVRWIQIFLGRTLYGSNLYF